MTQTCQHVNVNKCSDDCSSTSCAKCNCDYRYHQIHCLGLGYNCPKHGWTLPIGDTNCWHCWYENWTGRNKEPKIIKQTILVLRTNSISYAKDILEKVTPLRFNEEKHGNGPTHYACQIGDIVVEIYPEKS